MVNCLEIFSEVHHARRQIHVARRLEPGQVWARWMLTNDPLIAQQALQNFNALAQMIFNQQFYSLVVLLQDFLLKALLVYVFRDVGWNYIDGTWLSGNGERI